MKKDFYLKYYGQLVGMKILEVVEDEIDGEPVYGLLFCSNNSAKPTGVAWIEQDTEGNGPGFLRVQKKG